MSSGQVRVRPRPNLPDSRSESLGVIALPGQGDHFVVRPRCPAREDQNLVPLNALDRFQDEAPIAIALQPFMKIFSSTQAAAVGGEPHLGIVYAVERCQR